MLSPKKNLPFCLLDEADLVNEADLQTLSSLKKTMQMPLLKVAEEDCNGQAKPRGTFSPRPEQIGAPKQLCLACRKTEAARCMPTHLHCDASTHTAQIGCEDGGRELPTLVKWLSRRRSLMNFQARWMICVPALARTVFPLGSLWVLSLAKLGDFQTHLPFTLAGFFWCTTLSCSTPGTLAL